MRIADLLRTLQSSVPNCRILPAVGLPGLPAGHLLPDDLREFYHLCGGVFVREHSGFPLFIVSPVRLVPANPVIMVGLSDTQLVRWAEDLSSSWFILAEGENATYVTIDLSPQRLGQCYDSFWDRHPDNSPIIATSFGDFLERLVEARGRYYWDLDDFEPLGDPYGLGRQLR
jgi:antitoxin YokJ